MTEIETFAKAILDNPCIFSDDVIEAAHRAVTASHKDDNDSYKPWKPDGKSEFFSIRAHGNVGTAITPIPAYINNFNAFRTEETAKRAAEDSKIHNLPWQWKEKNDPDTSLENPYSVYLCNGSFTIIHLPFSSLTFGPFSTEEKASQFLRECKPYLDEYAKAMGWMESEK